MDKMPNIFKAQSDLQNERIPLMKKSLKMVASLIGATMVLALSPTGVANAAPPTPPTPIQTFIGNVDGSLMYPTNSPEARAIIKSINPTAPIAPVPFPAPEALSSGQVVQPYWNVGAGWYLYIYLNSGDISWLISAGYVAATAAICIWLAPTIGPGVACALAAYVVWTAIQPYAGVNKPGYCLEVSLWWGTFALHDVKWVQRNC